MAALIGHGASLVPKQETFDGRFWYVDDPSSAAHLFIVYHDRTRSHVVRSEEHKLSYVDCVFLSPTAMLGYGYLKLHDGAMTVVDNFNPALVDFIVRENLRASFEHAHRLRLPARGATAQDVYSALMCSRCASIEPRGSSPQWRRKVWAAHTSLSFDDKYDHHLTPEPI